MIEIVQLYVISAALSSFVLPADARRAACWAPQQLQMHCVFDGEDPFFRKKREHDICGTDILIFVLLKI